MNDRSPFRDPQVAGQRIQEFQPEFAVVAGIGLVWFAAALTRFRKSLVEGQS